MFTDNAIKIGGVSITYYAIMILVGAFIAYYFIKREWKYKGYDVKVIEDFFFNVILVGVVGARLWYVLFNLPMYLSNPITIIMTWYGGLAFHGGAIAGLIYGYFYFKKREYNFLDVADTILPYVLVAQAIGRWGNFFNQEAYGSAVSHSFLKNLMLPDFIIEKMFIDGSYHHPTFFYEFVFCMVGFIIIKFAIKKIPLKIGQSALLYGIFYSFGRIIVEQLRTDSLFFLNIKVAQLVSVIVIVVSVYLFYRFDKTQDQNTLQAIKEKK